MFNPKKIFFISVFFLIEDTIAYNKKDIQDLWKQKNFLFSSFKRLDQLGNDLIGSKSSILSFMTSGLNFQEYWNETLRIIEEHLTEENRDKCLASHENLINKLKNISECYENIFQKSKIKTVRLQDAQTNYTLFLNHLKITIEKVESKLKENEAIILGIEASHDLSRKAFLDASDYTLNSFLDESEKYEVIYRNSRQILAEVKQVTLALTKCQAKINVEEDGLFQEEILNCVHAV